MSTYGALVKKADKPSYAQVAYDGIKELISNEEIGPGELLSENQLADYFHMSRTPVREAIRRLQAEGLVEIRKGIGTFLKPLTAKDVKDIYEVRKAMELMACETSIYQITDEEIQEVRKNLEDLLRRRQSGEKIKSIDFSQIDGQFHDLIIQRSNNKYIELLMEQIYFNVDRYRRLSFHVSLDLEDITRQHLNLLKYLEQRDLKKLQDNLEKHLSWSLDLLLKHLEL